MFRFGGTVHTAPKLGRAAHTAPSLFLRILHITAYMRLLLAYIAIGQPRYCVSTQQVSLLSRSLFLELGGGGSNTLRVPQAKSWRRSVPASPPSPDSRATAVFFLVINFRLVSSPCIVLQMPHMPSGSLHHIYAFNFKFNVHVFIRCVATASLIRT